MFYFHCRSASYQISTGCTYETSTLRIIIICLPLSCSYLSVCLRSTTCILPSSSIYLLGLHTVRFCSSFASLFLPSHCNLSSSVFCRSSSYRNSFSSSPYHHLTSKFEKSFAYFTSTYSSPFSFHFISVCTTSGLSPTYPQRSGPNLHVAMEK